MSLVDNCIKKCCYPGCNNNGDCKYYNFTTNMHAWCKIIIFKENPKLCSSHYRQFSTWKNKCASCQKRFAKTSQKFTPSTHEKTHLKILQIDVRNVCHDCICKLRRSNKRDISHTFCVPGENDDPLSAMDYRLLNLVANNTFPELVDYASKLETLQNAVGDVLYQKLLNGEKYIDADLLEAVNIVNSADALIEAKITQLEKSGSAEDTEKEKEDERISQNEKRKKNMIAKKKKLSTCKSYKITLNNIALF